VTTWNLHGSERPDVARVAKALRTESPDVVLLQEIRHSQAVALAKSLGMRFSWDPKHFPYTRLLPQFAEGLTILTPHSLDAAGHAELSAGASKSSWERRIAQWAVIERPDGSILRAYNVHLSPHDRGAGRRLVEAVQLSTMVTEHGDVNDVIVGGDFNDDRDSSVIDALPGIEHMPPPPSCPSVAPVKVLDHVLIPPHASGVSVTVPGGDDQWAAISDHLPVTVRFTL
jgi:endonuclease/exonuclease/phosphatase family metal-dependent hydrolase